MLTTGIFIRLHGCNLTIHVHCVADGNFVLLSNIVCDNGYLHFEPTDFLPAKKWMQRVFRVHLCLCKSLLGWASTYADSSRPVYFFYSTCSICICKLGVIPLLGLIPFIPRSCKTTSTPVPSNT